MPKSKIDATLKKMAAGTPKAITPTSSSTETLGDPDCPHCHGLGYVRHDAEPGSPDFGKLDICTCRQGDVMRQVRDRLFSISHLDELKGLTFDSFQPRGRIGLGERQANSLEFAHNAARQYAASLKGWLLLQGGYGCGKTHLAAAIANFAVGMGVATLFLTVPDLLDLLRFSFDAEDVTFEQRFEQIRTAALLVLDDFGTQSASAWAQEKLFQIVNYRYINKLPLVVTTNVTINEIEDRIRSRLEDPELVSVLRIMVPDYRNPTDDAGHPGLSSLALLSKCSFADFSLREDEGLTPEEVGSLEKALKASIAFAEKPSGWFVITGPYGCGKTYLAAAIANYRANTGIPPIFVTAPDLFDHLRATFSPTSTVSYDRRFEEIRAAHFLIIDDLSTIAVTPWVREKLYQVINHRYNAELPTVFTSSEPLKDMDPRIRSRMLDVRLCKINAITAPAYHGRKKEMKKIGQKSPPKRR
jgi:DNA replication protein DnaC